MRRWSDRVAVVTGAGSGIGRALCEALARRGCDLVLVDRDEDGLAGTARGLQATGCKLSLHRVDVADRAQMECLPEVVLREHGRVHLLVNNAGVSVAGPFAEMSLDDFEWIVGVNFWGVVYGCKGFLPHLIREDQAHIVNILSDFGLIGFPTKSAYAATKFAVRGFSESLRAELHGTSVGLTCVYPGPVATNLVRSGRVADPVKQEQEAEFVRRRSIPVERVVERTLRGVERGRPRVLIGQETYFMDFMARHFPGVSARLLPLARKHLPFL